MSQPPRRSVAGALRSLRLVPALLAASLCLAGCNWLQFAGSSSHQGNNSSESTLTTANVSGLHQLFQTTLPSTADGAPAFVENVSTPGGTRNLLFVTTRAGDLVAVDAVTGAIVWQAHHPAGSCKINNGSSTCYTTSSPVVDPNLQDVYTYGLDGYVHKHDIGTGTEVTDAHWPVLSTLKPWDEKGSSALSTATDSTGTTYLYSVHSGYPGDGGDYQGHVTAIDLATGTSHVWNSLCSNLTVHFVPSTQAGTDCPEVQSGIWARPGVTYDSATDQIYLSTGNATFDPATHQWGDTVAALHPDGTGTAGGDPLNSFTPTNYAALNTSDADLGSALPALLPSDANATYKDLGVQGGKDAKLRFLNMSDLGGHGAAGFTGGEIGAIVNVPQGSQVLCAPVVWRDASKNIWIFVTTYNGLSGIRIGTAANGTPSFLPQWQTSGAATPSTPHVANGVLYVAAGSTIHAYNPTTGASLWSAAIGSIHWESPVVADGRLYVSDGGNHLTAFGL